MRLAALLIAIAACHRAPPPKPAPTGPTPEELALDAAIEAFYGPHLDFRPGLAIELGYHAYDGQVPDRSPAAIAAEIDRLRGALATFDDAAAIPASRQIEAALVRGEIRRELFDLEVRRRPWRDPFYYARAITLSSYVARDNAPLEDRARAMLAACEAAPAFYAEAAANLEVALPRPWIEVARGMTMGTMGFVSKDAPAAFAALDDAELAGDLGACLARLVDALAQYDGALELRLPDATTEFALGEDRLVAMLREAEGLDLDLATIDRVVRADLARNLAAITAAAHAIDPAREARDVIAEVTADKPDDVIAEATADLVTLRAFLVEHDLVTIPRDEVAEVRESPPFARGNFAFLSSGGAFEPVPQPSYFYLAPPSPTWPEAEQRAYLPSRADLLFIAAHEVWPGHFVQGMHERASSSRILKTFETYTTSEGWAHYVEEMMWDAGLGDGDPRAHIGQLKNALLRDVRALVAIGLHARDMTVDEAIAMFADQAFADPANAKQQAMRGTMDPLFLSYTLGKLIIVKLRDDWMAATGGDLKAFHDAFLAHGEAPLPAIRRAMLGAVGDVL